MPLRSFLPALLLLTAGFSPAQEQAGLPVDKSSAPKAAVPLPPKDDGTRVSILGYHEFSSTLAPSQMRIRTATFLKQM